MAVTNWLIDKSALTRIDTASDEWVSRMQRGAEHRLTLGEPPVSSMSVEHLTPAIEARAVEIQMLLADRGQHRAPSIPDLLIAATAEIARLTVLHIDKDFDLIAAITGQPIERLEV
jgi:predicted nucleic acid-binding protein